MCQDTPEVTPFTDHVEHNVLTKQKKSICSVKDLQRYLNVTHSSAKKISEKASIVVQQSQQQ